ncbi:MAG: type I restriction enzyme M protein [Alteromonadaceae bacterium]|jgi:type I restriction enzyme M protein
MNNDNNKLVKIIELLRKDTAINNAIDAMEQLSLMLLIKYLYEFNLVDLPNKSYLGSFENLFCKENNTIDFYALRQAVNYKVNDIDINEQDFIGAPLTYESWKTIESILEEIPFRIRSKNILNQALYLLESIDFFDNLPNNFDEVLSNMVKDSKASGAFYTPKPLIDALVNVSKPKPGQSVYDPAMGTGRSFISIKQYLFSTNDCYQLNATGNDITPFAYLIGVLNLLLNGIDINNISMSDSLLIENNSKYDFIISGIPFGVVNSFSKYEYGYHGYHGSLEAMFLKHSMNKLAINGQAILVVPEGVLFSGTNQLDQLRYELLTQFNLHSILSLPKGTLASYTGVKVSVLFFNNSASEKDIWFYELNTDKPISKLNPINDSDFEEFISLFEQRKTSKHSCLIDKDSLINEKSINLLFSLPKKEQQLKFQKMEMIESLKKDESDLVKLISSHFKSTSRNIDVEYLEQVTIKSICKLRTGDNLNKSEVSDSGECPVYGGNGIIGHYRDANRNGDSIIIGKVGMYCGNIHFSPKPYWLTSNAISLELTDNKIVFSPYLAHVLKSLDLNKLSTGAVQKFISIKQLYSLEISLPSYEKQIELSNWFDSLEENNANIQKSLSNFSDRLDSVTSSSIIEKALKNGRTL